MPQVAATLTDPDEQVAAVLRGLAAQDDAAPVVSTDAVTPAGASATLLISSGIPHLDTYLGGGIPAGSCLMLAGPPFSGKKLVARQFLASAVDQGAPFVAMLTGSAGFEWRRRMHQVAPGTAALEAAGGARYVDLVSRVVDPEASEPCTDYLDGALTLEAATHALGDALTAVGNTPRTRFVLDSLSTLAAFTTPSVALLALVHAVGRLKRIGATSMVLVDTGSHAETDLEVLKRQGDGILEFRANKGENEMRLVGLGLPRASPWVTYSIGRDQIDVTGSWNLTRLA